jgi:CRISPR/Cas system-associated exonuclease Cas4 (RecB family)
MLPNELVFSQSNLQDFVECARRFQYRYVQRIQWPAVESEPILEYERHMRQGAIFHRLVQQHILGVPAELLTRSASDEPLKTWWVNYLHSGLKDLPDQRHAEITLTAPLGKYRLLAKLDLLAIQPGERAVIVDWKTFRKRPKRARLESQLQTVVYRYLLVKAGSHLNGGAAIQPEQVEMVYWFANYPNQPESFPYDAAQFQADESALRTLVDDIASRGADDFPLTPDEKRCFFCTYRSLCDRGDKAGNFLERDITGETDLDFDIDFDQIAEIAF